MVTDPKAYYSKFPGEQVQGWLTFFTTAVDGLYPHPRGFDCGPCSSDRCGRIPCMTSETPDGAGLVNWQPKMNVQIIRELRIGLGIAQQDVACQLQECDGDVAVAPI